ncbi:MAG: COQ9 family protein [Proteobacteria bacterium]|nr:COQ9 family protein [Pseudomonadota bacterium]MBS0572848.1 COQ9 family protein [Pseudomonadota bacterium]
MSAERTTGAGDRARLLAAALPHVAFDGWTEATFRAAAADAGIAPDLARVLCPRGALDLAVDHHLAGDRALAQALEAADLGGLRFSQRVARAARLRIEGADREAVRRGTALFALPQHLATGSRLIWGTADAIWRALGDNSADINWYSKRMTLSAVYSATVLYWLGDDSPGHEATWDFLDRRIADVMRFEKTKADFRASGLGKALAGPLKLLDRVRAPAPIPSDLPGRKG